MDKVQRTGMAAMAVVAVILLTGCDSLLLNIDSFSETEEPELQDAYESNDGPGQQGNMAYSESESGTTSDIFSGDYPEETGDNGEGSETYLSAEALISGQQTDDSRVTVSQEEIESIRNQWVDAQATTIASDNDLEVAEAIVTDIYKRSGGLITGSSSLESVGEILREAGYSEVSAVWLLNTLNAAYTGEEGNVNPRTAAADDGSTHVHDFSCSYDGDTLRYECECGYSYSEDIHQIPLYITDDEFEKMKEGADISRLEPSGAEYRSMEPEEYFVKYLAPQLFFIFGENSYNWYCDPYTDDFDIYIRGTEDIRNLPESVMKMTDEEYKEWKMETEKVLLLSKYVRSVMYSAGYKAADITVHLTRDTESSAYTAYNGIKQYDLYEHFSS